MGPRVQPREHRQCWAHRRPLSGARVTVRTVTFRAVPVQSQIWGPAREQGTAGPGCPRDLGWVSPGSVSERPGLLPALRHAEGLLGCGCPPREARDCPSPPGPVTCGKGPCERVPSSQLASHVWPVGTRNVASAAGTQTGLCSTYVAGDWGVRCWAAPREWCRLPLLGVPGSQFQGGGLGCVA